MSLILILQLYYEQEVKAHYFCSGK